MYKLLVVEDEKSIAYGMANSIPWGEWGFEISGVCGNGLEALDQIKKDKPHVIISDIRMPEMDGIELMQYLNQHYPEIKIIILSGYNDFEYMQMSIKSQVSEYLLKPTDLDEFEVMFRKMKDRLDEENRKKIEEIELKQAYEEGKSLKLRKKFNDLIKGYGYNEEEMEEEFLQHDGNWFGVIRISFDVQNSVDKNAFYQKQIKIENLLNEKASKEQQIVGKFILNFEEKITGILKSEEEPEEEVLRSYTKKMLECVIGEGNINAYAGISNFYVDFQMLPQCYEQAKCCVGQKIYSEAKSQIMFYKEMQEADFDYYAISFDVEKILKEILEQQEKELEETLEQIFSEFRGKVILDYDCINRLSLELMFNLSRELLRYGVQLEKVMKKMDYTYTHIYTFKSLEGKKEFLFKILREVSKESARMKGEWKNRSSLAQQIKEIVDAEYDSNQISLEYVGTKVCKNTAYISKIFKNEFGCNFSDYIISKRLEKSQKLLADPALKIYEIAEEMGWADVSNYIKLFKKKYGMSPKEYRNILQAGGILQTGGNHPKGVGHAKDSEN
ncbi:response regulator transcription factor [Lachnoclostridium phytofermentans]|uniref:Stage 0 sporulation protein A homolog n=1 Tax=Lachnoclostridium phytofermentans (strain ATCC 700394 / DSM 18823 / ISDg) TaxID=357809 RepID=A9KQ79_LACP7|nr:response regulator [Lachnoclostridium phytofermentans]ABX43391.1 two component transcriptional regulator, AraC family [Lachnoclostridium phytofermentans ISDg]